jgi:hypothetical protein
MAGFGFSGAEKGDGAVGRTHGAVMLPLLARGRAPVCPASARELAQRLPMESAWKVKQ